VVEHAESQLPMEEMIAAALAGTVVEKFGFPLSGPDEDS
jgi:hypothetical protein